MIVFHTKIVLEIRWGFQVLVFEISRVLRCSKNVDFCNTQLKTTLKFIEFLGDDNATALDIETAFFQVEHEMEMDKCREQICLSEGKEKGKNWLFH